MIPALRLCTVVVFCLSVLPIPLRADDAFFSADGKQVTFIPWGVSVEPPDDKHLGEIGHLDLASKKITYQSLGDLVKGQPVTDIARGSDGELLFLTEKGVFVNDAKGTRLLAKLDGMENPRNLMVAPPKAGDIADCLFLVAETKRADAGDARRTIFFIRRPGQDRFTEVFCRRTEHVGGGAFSPNGRFYFAADGDVWEGTLDETLSAVRIAPLAFKQTDFCNAGALYTRNVSVVGNHLFAQLTGHHLRENVRIDLPKSSIIIKEGETEQFGEKPYEIMQQALASLQIQFLGEDLYASDPAFYEKDGIIKAVWTARDRWLYLSENGQKGERIAQEK